MRKRIWKLLLFFMLVLLVVPAQAVDVDLYSLSRSELEQLDSDIDSVQKQYHIKLSSAEEKALLSAVENAVEGQLKGRGLSNISWPWLDYTYSRRWNLLSVKTHVDAKDTNKEKQRFQVYGETFPLDGKHELIYLKLDNIEIIDRREELPDPLWQPIESHFINERTELDLTVLSGIELASLRENIEVSLEQNHCTESAGQHAISDLVEKYVDSFFAKKNFTVSWPIFDYSYTCDWGYYTETTKINCKDSENKKFSYKIYAEACKVENMYEILYLTIGDEVVIDLREEVQAKPYHMYTMSQLYSKAQTYFADGKYSEARDIFISLGTFSNSRSKTYLCIEQLMGAEYTQAIRLFDEGQYEEAKLIFVSLGDQGDSAEQAQKCQDEINAINYKDALALMQSKKYDEALLLFTELGEYSDSSERAERCFVAIQDREYQHACDLRDQQLYLEAMDIFADLGSFKDSADQVVFCANAYNQAQYNAALTFMDAEEYSEALAILTELGIYKDAPTLASSCQEKLNEEAYAYAMVLMSGGHYDSAYEAFISLKDYSDSAEQAAKCLTSKANVDRKIVLPETEVIIFRGKTLQLKPEVERLNDTAPETSKMKFTSCDTSIVRVQQNGTISTVKEGSTRILCSTEDNPDNVTEVFVRVVLPVQRVSLDRSEMKIPMDMNAPSSAAVTLQATITPENAFDQSVTWTSSNEDVAVVDENGLVTPVSTGTATITATANDSTNGVRKASCYVRVTLAVTDVQLDKTSGTVFIGKTEKLTATVLPDKAADKKLTWSSSDTSVATVNSSGTVTGVSTGKATITAKASSGTEASYVVTVKQGPASFYVSINTSIISNDHVGSNWRKEFFVDDVQFSGSTTFTAEVNQTVEISGEIYDNDSNPDSGYFILNLEMTEDVFKNGYSEEKTIYVRENGGRYSGNLAEWRVVITVRKR